MQETDETPEEKNLYGGYRLELYPEYYQVGPQAGQLKPLGRWLGVTPTAKKISKKLGRQSHAQEKTEIINVGIEDAKQATVSRKIRSRKISEHNREAAQRERDLALGVTREQRLARAQHVRDLLKERKKLPETIADFSPVQGGPIHTFLGRIKNEGYLGEELRAIRKEQTRAALMDGGLYKQLTRDWDMS